jgi:hypothetical protein
MLLHSGERSIKGSSTKDKNNHQKLKNGVFS